MRRDKQADFALEFARFCILQDIAPTDAIELVGLARAAFRAGERDCNRGTDASETAYRLAREAFKVKAKSLGFEAYFPGLWPSLWKAGGYVRLPAC